jgi:hypothetical protein
MSLLPLITSVGVILSGIDNEFGGPIRDRVPAGDYFVNVGLPQGSYVKEMTFNSVSITGGELHLAPAASGTLHVLMARGTPELAVDALIGHVRFDERGWETGRASASVLAPILDSTNYTR